MKVYAIFNSNEKIETCLYGNHFLIFRTIEDAREYLDDPVGCENLKIKEMEIMNVRKVC